MVAKSDKKPAKKGAPTKFTPELGLELCARIMEGKTLRSACIVKEGMPDKATVFRWLAKGDADDAETEFRTFRDQYARACRLRREYKFEQLEEDLSELAKEPLIDKDTGQVVMCEGKPVMTMTNVSIQFAKLMQDTFKWQASKEDPKKYGERVTNEVVGEGGGPIRTVERVIVRSKSTDTDG